MAQPPIPDPTDPGQHAPGISRTLEEGAAKAREDQEKLRDQTEPEPEATKGLPKA